MRPWQRIDYGSRLARAYLDTAERMSLDENIKIENLSQRACDAFSLTWAKHPERKVSWDWHLALNTRRMHRDCFHVAIWHRETLCGLSIGKSRAGKHVGIELVEGNPDQQHPLKGYIIPIVLTAAEFYRIQLSTPELRLYKAETALIPLYKKFGFELAPELGDPHDMRRRS